MVLLLLYAFLPLPAVFRLALFLLTLYYIKVLFFLLLFLYTYFDENFVVTDVVVHTPLRSQGITRGDITSMSPYRGSVSSFQMAACTRILSVETSLYLVRNGAKEKIDPCHSNTAIILRNNEQLTHEDGYIAINFDFELPSNRSYERVFPKHDIGQRVEAFN